MKGSITEPSESVKKPHMVLFKQCTFYIFIGLFIKNVSVNSNLSL